MSVLTVLKFNYSESLVFTATLIFFVSTGWNEYEYDIDIKLITLETCLIHMPLIIQIHKFRKILVNDSIYSSIFAALVVAANKDSKQSEHTTF